jgi:peptidoglycan/LPS O-acetylase OafA/YrhL
LVGHTNSELNRAAAAGGTAFGAIRFPGGFGVDLFFAVSGFIMVMASSRLFSQRDAARVFLARRVTRVAPLYWLVTLVYVVVLLAGSHGYSGVLGKAAVAALLFFPYPTYGVDLSGNVYPLYSLGWTLNYEVFFYALFAGFVRFPQSKAIYSTIGALVALAVLGRVFDFQVISLRFWTEPIILEFGAGMLVAQLTCREVAIPRAVPVVLILAALAYVLADPMGLTWKYPGASTPDDFRRVIGWGFPAALLLLGAVLTEKRVIFHSVAIRMGAFLGDCSYSLYLAHPLVLIALIKMWKDTQHSKLGILPLGVAIVVLSYICAIATYACVERPLTARLHRSLLGAGRVA